MLERSTELDNGEEVRAKPKVVVAEGSGAGTWQVTNEEPFAFDSDPITFESTGTGGDGARQHADRSWKKATIEYHAIELSFEYVARDFASLPRFLKDEYQLNTAGELLIEPIRGRTMSLDIDSVAAVQQLATVDANGNMSGLSDGPAVAHQPRRMAVRDQICLHRCAIRANACGHLLACEGNDDDQNRADYRAWDDWHATAEQLMRPRTKIRVPKYLAPIAETVARRGKYHSQRRGDRFAHSEIRTAANGAGATRARGKRRPSPASRRRDSFLGRLSFSSASTNGIHVIGGRSVELRSSTLMPRACRRSGFVSFGDIMCDVSDYRCCDLLGPLQVVVDSGGSDPIFFRTAVATRLRTASMP